jgi:hypothetical protein
LPRRSPGQDTGGWCHRRPVPGPAATAARRPESARPRLVRDLELPGSSRGGGRPDAVVGGRIAPPLAGHGWLLPAEGLGSPARIIEEYDSSQRDILGYNGDPDTHGSSEVVQIREGIQALVTTSVDRSSSTIFWRRGRTEIAIYGPELQRDEVIAIARSI